MIQLDFFTHFLYFWNFRVKNLKVVKDWKMWKIKKIWKSWFFLMKSRIFLNLKIKKKIKISKSEKCWKCRKKSKNSSAFFVCEFFCFNFCLLFFFGSSRKIFVFWSIFFHIKIFFPGRVFFLRIPIFFQIWHFQISDLRFSIFLSLIVDTRFSHISKH